MRRAEWTELAHHLASLRSELASKWPPSSGYRADFHDRKLIHFARLDGVDKAARAVCRALRARSSRFDGEKFLRIVGTKK